MKIWNNYGSEHSSNLVMIGSFKNIEDAEEVYQLIENLKKEIDGKIEVGNPPTRYSDNLSDLMRKYDCYSVGLSEFEQLLYDFSIEIKDEKLIVTTEEQDISALLKLMIKQGAKVEIYSAHDYPKTDYGR